MDSNSKFFFKHPQYSEMIIYFEVIDLYLCGLELIKERFCGLALCYLTLVVYQVWKALKHIGEAIILPIQLPLTDNSFS